MPLLDRAGISKPVNWYCFSLPADKSSSSAGSFCSRRMRRAQSVNLVMSNSLLLSSAWTSNLNSLLLLTSGCFQVVEQGPHILATLPTFKTVFLVSLEQTRTKARDGSGSLTASPRLLTQSCQPRPSSQQWCPWQSDAPRWCDSSWTRHDLRWHMELPSATPLQSSERREHIVMCRPTQQFRQPLLGLNRNRHRHTVASAASEMNL